MSLLGQLIIMVIALVSLLFGDVSFKGAIISILVLLVFSFVFSVTILRLRHLANITDTPDSPMHD